jgi:uncharacterized protein (TIGR03435 family)
MRAEFVGVLLLAAFTGSAQTGHPPAFEVASVKKAADPNGVTLTKGGPGTPSPTFWTGVNWSLNLLIVRGWGLPQSQIAGPGSMEDARYDMTARVPPNTSPDDFNLMLRTLLTERVGLVVHHELREQPVYEMSIARSGLKMREATPLQEGEKARAYSGNGVDGGQRLVARMTRFSDIVTWWSKFFLRAPVVDRTGLSGYFDFVLDLPPRDPQDVPPGEASLPLLTFPEAVEKQLGLKLEARKAKVDVLVVDRFEKDPSDN